MAKPERCRNCDEPPGEHRGGQCPPDYDSFYLHPYATEIEIKRWQGGMLPKRGARN